ncbi:glycoside hydrolase family 3 protein [Candidatus Nomurabacteria bacterium]|nr:glycoside hydrolase family 3 protein [Candidatus Nomurabacteria bacterium]
MTLEEKIGQMTLVEKDSIKKLSDISDYHLGALLSGSGSKPEENTVTGWKQMIDTYQAEATQSRLGIPLLYGSDAIHGHAHVPEATIFPHLIGLGASGDSELVKKIASATAVEMMATGVNWNFAPNLDMPQDIRWGRVYETFSDDPTLVTKLGAAYVQGLQTAANNTDEQLQVLATPKHFVGLGGMSWDTSLNKNFKIDQGVTDANEALLNEVYLPPFAAAIDAGALNIMVGLNTWGDDRMVRQKHLLTDVLKKQLGFKGFIVSDWYGVHEGTHNTFWATTVAINSGVDMVMLPFDYETFTRQVKWANRLGLISDARIDDAVSRILYAKFSLGLFDQAGSTETLTTIPNQAHRALAREAVAQSLVLLKNENSILPLKTNVRKIRVAGSAANNIGKQSGAWTIEWQGVDGNWLPNSTSILAGIKEIANKNTQIEFEEQALFSTDSDQADVGIAIVGESPYAEGWGDNAKPSLSDEDLTTIKNLKQTSRSVVVILVTGRPLIITDEIKDWDAVVVAWLPGSEGAGVADVLFGTKPFTGSLPLPWPSNINQLPITINGESSNDSNVLFSRYFKLLY